MEGRRILNPVKPSDHRAALTTIYSCGLRLGEGLNLQVNLGQSSPVIAVRYAHLTSLCKTQHQKRLDELMGDLA